MLQSRFGNGPPLNRDHDHDNFKGTGVNELTADELDIVSGGSFLSKVFDIVLGKAIDGYLREAGQGYGEIIKQVADAAGKRGGGKPQ